VPIVEWGAESELTADDLVTARMRPGPAPVARGDAEQEPDNVYSTGADDVLENAARPHRRGGGLPCAPPKAPISG
jgi:hypothetical protein